MHIAFTLIARRSDNAIRSFQELLREQRTLGHLDARYLLVDAEDSASAAHTDRTGGSGQGFSS